MATDMTVNEVQPSVETLRERGLDISFLKLRSHDNATAHVGVQSKTDKKQVLFLCGRVNKRRPIAVKGHEMLCVRCQESLAALSDTGEDLEVERFVAVLPTGDWAVINRENPIAVYHMDAMAWHRFMESGGEDTSEGRGVSMSIDANGVMELDRLGE